MITLYKVLHKIFEYIEDFRHSIYIKICKSYGLKTGNRTVIRKGVNFGSEPFLIEVGDDTRIASGTSFVTHSGGTVNLRKISDEYTDVRNFGRIKIGKNCAIGLNCVILQDVKMGDNCILGANSVLSESMPDNTVYAGNPAKYVCEIEDYGDFLLKTSLDYPLELEKDKKELNNWLKTNLHENFKASR